MNEFKNELIENIKNDIGNDKVEKILFEGPKIIIYVNNKETFLKGNDIGSELAKKYKKRIEIRMYYKYLSEDIEIKEKVENILNSYNIKYKNIFVERHRSIIVIESFNIEDFNKEIINKIREETLCNIEIKRAPLKSSKIIDSIRNYLHKISKYRSEFLNDVGIKILTKKEIKNQFYRITVLGAGREVGRSSFLLQTKESSILIDCGMGVGNYSEDKYPMINIRDFDLYSIDAVVISHAHFDHIGFLPYLFRMGWKGAVYLTEPTRDIGALVMLDYLKVSNKQYKEAIYTSEDIKKFLKNTVTLKYNEVTDITPDIKITLTNANHILGSAMVHINIENKHNILYTGDFKYNPTTLFNPPNTKYQRLETLIIESTYGGKDDIHPSREETEIEFLRDIKNVIENKGKVLIPSLAIGRAQDLILTLSNAIKNNQIPYVNIYLEGVLWETSMIHTAYPEYLNDNIKQMILNKYNPFEQEFIIRATKKERNQIMESNEPAIIIATSGMMNGGPILEYFKLGADNEKNLLALVSYQAPGTLGRRLLEGEKEVVINNEKVNVKLNIKKYSGFSGHADIKEIISFTKRLRPKPKQALVVHGEPEKTSNVVNVFRKFGIEAYNPKIGDSIRLD